jgi:hypothetical protein
MCGILLAEVCCAVTPVSPLHAPIQSYSLELHHLTPSGILYMVSFVTLCEAFIGIEPQLNLWSYFFQARL